MIWGTAAAHSAVDGCGVEWCARDKPTRCGGQRSRVVRAGKEHCGQCGWREGCRRPSTSSNHEWVRLGAIYVFLQVSRPVCRWVSRRESEQRDDWCGGGDEWSRGAYGGLSCLPHLNSLLLLLQKFLCSFLLFLGRRDIGHDTSRKSRWCAGMCVEDAVDARSRCQYMPMMEGGVGREKKKSREIRSQ